LSRYRAERLLRKDFAGLRAKVLTIVRGQLRAKGIALDPADLEACYAQAWHGLYATMLSGEQVENPSAWLVLVTFRRAIDEHRAAGRAGVVGLGDIGSFPSGFEAARTDLAAELDDRVRLREVFEALRSRLSPRECEVASLCYLQGLSRAEAAERMGISEARMRKLMEGAGPARPGVAGKVGELLETIEAGGWCEQQSSLMRAYAFGILDPDGERHALAVAHCRECPACRVHVASLRGLASVLPLPLPPMLATAGGGASAVAGRAATNGGAARRLAVRMSGAAGRPASGGAAAARRLTARLSRVAGRPATAGAADATRTGLGGWSGFTGSLTAKLAATAVVLVAGGYAALGVHAHASPVGRRAQPAQSALAPAPLGSARSRAPFGGAPGARGGHVPRKPTSHRAHRRPAAGVRPIPPSAEAAAREFGPERTSGPVRTQSTASPNGSPAGEFGFE
jgi:RNA polymerase sigma factor (sigma-70 family)